MPPHKQVECGDIKCMPEMLCQISQIILLQQTLALEDFFPWIKKGVSKMPACSQTLQLGTADLLITLMLINAGVNN